jgi:hypothetical protein
VAGGHEVVRSAAQGEVVGGGRAASGVGLQVVELQPMGFGAPTIVRGERAPALVPLPDGAPHRPRDVSRLGSGWPRRSACGAALPLLQDLEGRLDADAQELVELAGGDAMAQEGADLGELLREVVIHGDPQQVPVAGDPLTN